VSLTRARAAASAARRPVVSPVPDGLDRPFWSVMIPTYDGGDRLARTIESVLEQDPGEDEMQIRVVDDASPTADPRPLVREVAGGRVSVWRQPRNVGAPTNFTTCVQQAVGRWVHILHDDDIVLPGFYAAYRHRIEQQPCTMVVGRSFHVDDDEQTIAVSPEVAVEGGYLVDAPLVVARDHPFNFVAVVVARDAYESAGGFDPELVHANDWEMWARLAMLGPVGVVAEPLARYRHHADSDTNRLRRSTAHLDDVLRAIDIIAERFEDPRAGRRFRREARLRWSGIALDVAEQARAAGDPRAARANAWASARLDPRPAHARRAWRVAGPGLRSGRS